MFVSKSTDYSNFFIPPKGYTTEGILLLTYSLNLAMIEEIIIKSKIANVTSSKALTERFDSLADENKFLCAVQKDRGTNIFEEREDNRNAWQMYKRGAVHPIEKKDGKSFHPKLCAFLYKNSENENKFRLRLFISSRNLSRQNMIEGAICFETESFSDAANNKLSELISLIKEVAFPNIQSDIIDFLSKADFTDCIKSFLPEDYDLVDYSILTNKHEVNGSKGLKSSFPVTCNAITVVSPFLGDDAVIDLRDNNLKKTEHKKLNFISRQKSYTQKLHTEAINVYYIEGANRNKSEITLDNEEENGISFTLDEIPLHAKIYAFDKDKESWLFIGSANCTDNGLMNNHELLFMIHIEKKSEIEGFANLLYNSFKNDSFYNIKKCSTPYQSNGNDFPAGNNIDIPESLSDEERKKLQESAKKIIEERDATEMWEVLSRLCNIKNGKTYPVDYLINYLMSVEENDLQAFLERVKDFDNTQVQGEHIKIIVEELKQFAK